MSQLGMEEPSSTLYLLPSPIADEGFSFFPEANWACMNDVNLFIVENLKDARRNLRKVGFKGVFDDQEFLEWNENSTDLDKQNIFKRLLQKKRAILMSDAGLPCVADPGNQVVAFAQRNHFKIQGWVGPSSILLTLMGSGFNGQQFRFHGYLPREKNDRIKTLKILEQKANQGETQLFMDTPYRNSSVWEDMMQQLSPDTLVCVGAHLQSPNEILKTDSISNWKKQKIQLHKIPVMFAIGK
jgi:16S rRNA (cytidine1402-2'-O)-methyltransferase